MAESNQDEIVAALRKEENRVSAAVQQAREKAKALETELKGIRSALAALTGQSNRAPKKKSKPSSDKDADTETKKTGSKRAFETELIAGWGRVGLTLIISGPEGPVHAEVALTSGTWREWSAAAVASAASAKDFCKMHTCGLAA